MEYQLSQVTRYAVNCESCDTGTGNHGQAETAHKAARAKGFIAIVTPEDGTINLCPACIPDGIAGFFKPADKAPDDESGEQNLPLKAGNE